MDGLEGAGFLPPRPAGPEPELGRAPAAPPPPPPGYAHPQWGYPPRPAEPDNGPAVAGFVLSVVSGGLLLISLGTSSVISITCAVFGLVYSRKGKRKVQEGETRKHAGLAQAGFVIAIVSLVLSVIATLAYVALIVVYATDDQFRHDINDDSGGNSPVPATLRTAAMAGRALLT